jgi:hypothetical protein
VRLFAKPKLFFVAEIIARKNSAAVLKKIACVALASSCAWS